MKDGCGDAMERSAAQEQEEEEEVEVAAVQVAMTKMTLRRFRKNPRQGSRSVCLTAATAINPNSGSTRRRKQASVFVESDQLICTKETIVQQEWRVFFFLVFFFSCFDSQKGKKGV